MKKVKIAFIGLMLLGFTAGVFAQDKKDAAVKSTKPSKSTKATAADKSAPAKASKSAAPAKDAKANSGQHLKKDGTPDMRYKENKQAAKSTGSKSTSTKKAASSKDASANDKK